MTDLPTTVPRRMCGTMCDPGDGAKTVEVIKHEDPSAEDFKFYTDPVCRRTSITYTSTRPTPPQPKGK